MVTDLFAYKSTSDIPIAIFLIKSRPIGETLSILYSKSIVNTIYVAAIPILPD